MAMSRKHYEQIAAEIAEARNLRIDTGERVAIDIVAARLANVFAADNPRFDRGRFLAAAMKDAGAGDLPDPVPHVGVPVRIRDEAGRVKPAARR